MLEVKRSADTDDYLRPELQLIQWISYSLILFSVFKFSNLNNVNNTSDINCRTKQNFFTSAELVCYNFLCPIVI